MVAEFFADRLTTDGGVLVLRQVDRRIPLLSRFAGCFLDGRDPDRLEHTVTEMVAQRVYGLALGYEDLNNHEQLRHDRLLGLLAGKRDLDSALAGKSTLNRMELSGLPVSSRHHKIRYSSVRLLFLMAEPENFGVSPASETPQKQVYPHPEAEIRPIENSCDGQKIQDNQKAQQ